MPGGSAPGAPFLRLEGRGGRFITSPGDTLTYQAGPRAAPVTLEIARIETVRLSRRSTLPLLPTGMAVPILLAGLDRSFFWPAVIALLVALPVFFLRTYHLEVRTRDGVKRRWFLGVVWLGSQKLRALDQAWPEAARALASRGVTVKEGPGRLGRGA